ncbi:MAG: pyruvate carboxylase subunit B [Kiloniellaceae bacterium]
MGRTVRLIDVTLRDAHQCLWATRMTTAMMKEIVPLLDRAGFEAIDLVGGAVFDVAVRYLRENPWERMRIVSSWVTRTPLVIHTRGQSLFTFDFFADDVVELAAERFVANGMRYHTPYDALNDIRNLEVPVRAAKRAGLHTVGGLVYTFSPVHTDDYYVAKARRLIALGVDGVFIKDPSGLLTPERVATLVPALKSVCGNLPLQLHMHCLTGLAPYTALRAVDYGVDVVHTATSTLANGASHSPTELFTRNCRRRGHEVLIDLAPVEEAAGRLAFIAEREDKPVGRPLEYDEFHFHHQVPGGMVSNLKYQLETLGIAERLEQILEEAGRVRADLGYPIVVSPFAQYIITQAVLNVMGKERYATVPDEVRRYVIGGYGEIAGRIDPDLYDRIARGAAPITERPGALVPPALERIRRDRGPFASDDDLLLAAFYTRPECDALKAAGRIDTDYALAETPLVTLVKEIAARPGIRSIHLTRNGAQ